MGFNIWFQMILEEYGCLTTLQRRGKSQIEFGQLKIIKLFQWQSV